MWETKCHKQPGGPITGPRKCQNNDGATAPWQFLCEKWLQKWGWEHEKHIIYHIYIDIHVDGIVKDDRRRSSRTMRTKCRSKVEWIHLSHGHGLNQAIGWEILTCGIWQSPHEPWPRRPWVSIESIESAKTGNNHATMKTGQSQNQFPWNVGQKSCIMPFCMIYGLVNWNSQATMQ